ncbi:MAG: site-specific integrase, partial [Proteobacteria bacterium]|nr:site-specific integrase [Pseudomonadota bacterium]
MGSIYKRGAVWWVQYYKDGRPFRESTRSVKEADAKRLLKRREGEIAEGKLPGVYFDRVRFDELAADYLTDYRTSGKKDVHNTTVRVSLHLAPFFGGLRVVDITTAKVREYTALRLEGGAAHGTINRELSALKRMFNLAGKSTPPKVGQVPYIPMLKEDNIRKGFFEADEFLALRANLPPELRGPATFAYKVGWRRGEIFNLKWSAVDLDQGTVRLEAGETKSGEGRIIYLDDELKAIIREQFVNRHLGSPLVFHKAGRFIGEFRPAWRHACRAAGLKDKLFHDLRRTAVRNMVRAGVPERVAMMISGHKTRSVFERYNIVSGDDLKRASALIETYFQDQTATVSSTVGEKSKKKGQAKEPNPLKSLVSRQGIEPRTYGLRV